MGDSSDNNSGVPGVGEKTAQAQAAEAKASGGLDTLHMRNRRRLNWLPRRAKTMAAKLEQNKDVAYLLSAGDHQMTSSWSSCEELEVQPPAADDLLALFRQYESKRWTTSTLRPENGCRLRGKPVAKPADNPAAAEAEEELKPLLHSAEHYVTILDEATLVPGSIS